RSGARIIPDRGPAGRRQGPADRQPGAEPVHERAELAVRIGVVAAAARSAARGDAGSRKDIRGRARAMKRRLVTLVAVLGFVSLLLPLVLLVIWSFNAS